MKFITKAAWESSEINIHTLTSIFILVAQGRLPYYTLNTHLFSSQPCESTFRSARSLTGPFSSITNFTVQQFLTKAEKISVLNRIKSIEDNSNSPCALKFPTHHKNNHSSISKQTTDQVVKSLSLMDIEKLVNQAYENARKILNSFSMLKILEKNNIHDLHSLNSYVLKEREKSLQVDYSTLDKTFSYDGSDDNDDNSDEEHEIDDFDDCDSIGSDFNTGDDTIDQNNRLETTKQTFNGMRIYDQIHPTQENNHFEVSINGTKKFINKQTAARLLTVNKYRLSSDRLSRVQQSKRQR